MKITQTMISKYTNLVNRNCHGEVLAEVAKDVKANYFVIIFNNINQIHDLEGSLSHDVYTVRERFRQEFKNYLQQHLTKEEYESIARFV